MEKNAGKNVAFAYGSSAAVLFVLQDIQLQISFKVATQNADRFHGVSPSHNVWSPCLCRDGKVSLPGVNSWSLQTHQLFHSEFRGWIRSMTYGHWIPIVFKQEGCPLCKTIVARQQLIFSSQATILPVEKCTFLKTNHTFLFPGSFDTISSNKDTKDTFWHPQEWF